jgi:hypothetical protein
MRCYVIVADVVDMVSLQRRSFGRFEKACV